MVSKASDDFPDPESPVKTTSLSLGIVRSMSFKLCSRAPRMTISVCCPGFCSLPVWVGPFDLATDLRPHATGLRFAPLARLGGGRRRQRVAIFHGVAAQPY